MTNTPHIVLAALATGEHVQVGRARSHDQAHKLFDSLDSQISGFHRVNGQLRSGAPRKTHFIGGIAVSFYRVRQTPNEFGTVRAFPVRSIRSTNRPKEGSKTMSTKTNSGIKRPASGTFKTFAQARTVAKARNITNGRGHRALKATNGGYGIIFRPAVANNKQRKVREV